MKFLYPLNLTKNELQNAVIQNLAQAPESPKKGQIYFDTQLDDFRIYNGTSWVSALAPGTSINGRTGAVQLNGGNVISINEDPNGTFTFNHDTISNTNLAAQARRYVTGLTFDDYGHITGYTTGTETVVNTDTITRLRGTTAGSFQSGDITLLGGSKLSVSQGGTGNRDLTISHDDLASAYTTSADDLTALASIELLNSLIVDASGHVSAAKFRKLVAGSNVTITPSSNGNITIASSFVNTTYTAGTYLTLSGTEFNHDATTRTNTSNTSSPNFGATFDVIDSISSNATGHITGVNTRTITVPAETTLSLVDNGTGTWMTGIAVDDHQITVSRSSSTTDTITVGELIVSNSGAGNGNVTIAGDLTVNGTTTTISTETVEIEDNLILINKVDASQEPYTPPTSLVGGLQIYRGTETDYKFVFVEEFEDFRIGEIGDLQPVLTRDETDNFEDEDLLIWDDANNRAVGAKPADLGIPRKYAVTQAIATGQTYTITHNLGTQDVTVSLKDNATNEFVYADIETTGNNTIEISFGEINSVENVRVIVIG